MLPGIDDGAPDLETSQAMARLAVADGITITDCRPHIVSDVYDNQGPPILSVIEALQGQLNDAGIPLSLTSGCDANLAPNLHQGLKEGLVFSLGESPYLFELPRHMAPPPACGSHP